MLLRRELETDKFKRICNTIKEAVFILDSEHLTESGMPSRMKDHLKTNSALESDNEIQVVHTNKIASKWL